MFILNRNLTITQNAGFIYFEPLAGIIDGSSLVSIYVPELISAAAVGASYVTASLTIALQGELIGSSFNYGNLVTDWLDGEVDGSSELIGFLVDSTELSASISSAGSLAGEIVDTLQATSESRSILEGNLLSTFAGVLPGSSILTGNIETIFAGVLDGSTYLAGFITLPDFISATLESDSFISGTMIETLQGVVIGNSTATSTLILVKSNIFGILDGISSVGGDLFLAVDNDLRGTLVGNSYSDSYFIIPVSRLRRLENIKIVASN